MLSVVVPYGLVQSTDHELIPPRNVSLVTMQGSASGSNVLTLQHEHIRTSKKEMNKAVTLSLQNTNCQMCAVRLWITTLPYRWPVRNLPSTCMFVLPPHCTKDVYTPQGWTHDLWTVRRYHCVVETYLCISPRDVTTRKTNNDIFSAMRTLNIKRTSLFRIVLKWLFLKHWFSSNRKVYCLKTG
jgi:hypothetical protein